MLEAQSATAGWVAEWRGSLSDDDIITKFALHEVAEIFNEARRRGCRTPHK